MQSLKYVIYLYYLMLSLASPCAYAFNVIDDAGQTIQLNRPATRIISLAPDITEILFAIGAGSLIVGTVDSSNYPQAAKNIMRVGSYSGLDAERIMSLKPDLIVTWGQSFSRELVLFKKLSIPIYVNKPLQLEDVAKTMRQLGTLTQHIAEAEKTANAYLNQLNDVKKQNQSLTPIKVFYQIGSHALFTVNKESWINQAITVCGGENIFIDAKLIGAEVNMEAVMIRHPQIIISDANKTSDWKIRWQAFAMIPAVKNKLLFEINPDWIDRAGPRLVLGVTAMCSDINQARAHYSHHSYM